MADNVGEGGGVGDAKEKNCSSQLFCGGSSVLGMNRILICLIPNILFSTAVLRWILSAGDAPDTDLHDP